MQRELGGRLYSALAEDGDHEIHRWVQDAGHFPKEVVRDFVVLRLQATAGDFRAKLVQVYRELGLLRMVEPFIYDSRNVVAVGGMVRLANGCVVRDGVLAQSGLPGSLLARARRVGGRLRLAAAQVSGMPTLQCYEVPSARLSFFGRRDALLELTRRAPPFPAFAGWVIHGLESFYPPGK